MKKLFLFVLFAVVSVSLGAQVDFKQGIKLMENENYTEASKFFDGVVAKDPKNGTAFYYLGQIKYLLEDFSGAEELYKKGTTANPKCVECQIAVNKIKLDNGMNVEAEKALESLAKSNKKNASVLAQIGEAFLYNRKPKAAKAIEYLTRARDIDPKNASTWAKLGDAHKLGGDSGSAMTAYETAVEKDPSNIEAIMKQATIWANSRQLDLAIKKLGDAIKLKDDYAPAYKLIYELYTKANRFNEALPFLQKYSKLAGTDVKAKERLVKFLAYSAKDYDQSIKEGIELLKTNPEEYTVHRWMAWSYGEKGMHEEAYQSSKKLFEAVDKDPKRKLYESDYRYYAQAALQTSKQDTSRFSQAVKLYDKYLTFDPTKSEAVWGDFAKSSYDAKDYAKAIQFYQKKNEIKALGLNDLVNLAEAYRRNNKLAEAQSTYLKVVEASPNYTFGYQQLAKISETFDTDKENPQGLAKPYLVKYVELATGDLAKATTDDAKKRIINGLVSAYDDLGTLASKKNEITNAISYFESLLQLDPANARGIKYLEILKSGGK